ncbi:MAG: phosphoglycerate kinase [Pseudomonadota bacterium]|nr:phosphoglycerate kinase [Gammaproteobacteria bacterium]MEC8010829.1 phosphoglycerate kinase [Pseudomonadota bacterium]HBF08479.1 phosphoglycerate kinase [Gammaproteobacteria bacterium]|tara:strand:- start:91691 stop:92872 length:1182 start_codon:yes stop_codon:yes gene_type:complete
MKVLSMSDVDLKGRRVLIREDLNVPLKDGKITNDARLRAALPTIKKALSAGAQVILMSHLGRPKEGVFDESLSLKPVVEYLENELGRSIALTHEWQEGLSAEVAEHDLIVLENIRFNVGEKSNDKELSQKMANLCDVFVMDAFGTAHRAQSSTAGVVEFAPIACAGPLLEAELEALGSVMHEPKKPLVAVVGGSKVSTKLTVLEQLAHKVNLLVVGGGIANTFLAAKGYNVGKSLCEPDLIPAAKKIMELTEVFIPADVVVASEFSADAAPTVKNADEVGDEDMILDVGPQACHQLHERMISAGTILWNGPLGVFEFESFSAGTRILSESIGKSSAYSLAGGGDTLAAIDQFDVAEDISYISTGGGAFLEFLEGRELPAVAALKAKAAQSEPA